MFRSEQEFCRVPCTLLNHIKTCSELQKVKNYRIITQHFLREIASKLDAARPIYKNGHIKTSEPKHKGFHVV